MEIICVANQKGGIGKTTTATTLATALSDLGFRVLFIDSDAQCNSTDTYQAKTKDTATLYDVILDTEDPLPIKEAIQHTPIGDIVAADPELKHSEELLPKNGLVLKNALIPVTEYDYIIIDTAPANNSLLRTCLNAATQVIIPLTADRYSLQGLADLNRTIHECKISNNPNLKIAGLLLIKYKKREILARQVKNTLETEIAPKMDTKVFNTTIRESNNVQKAQAKRTSLLKYAPKCTTSIDYIELAKELIKGVN